MSLEIARERAEIRVGRRFAALPRPSKVQQHCAEPRYAAAREIAGDVGPKFSKSFRGRRIFRSRSRENAPKSVSTEDLQPCDDPQRFISTVRSLGMLRRVRLRAMSDRNFRKFYAAAEFFVRNRARTRRNPCRPMTCSLATSLRGPSALCGASACCGA